MLNARAKASESLVEATALSAVDLFKDLPVACLRTLEEGSGLRDFRKGHIFSVLVRAASACFSSRRDECKPIAPPARGS